MQNKAMEYVRKHLNLSEDESLALQHWLRVLGENTEDLVLQCDDWNAGIDSARAVDSENRKVYFNLTTGQPATEADYQAFCEIVGISQD